jgi:FKBP-type peptidyl-prolyl cis-trans isomerase SlyD
MIVEGSRVSIEYTLTVNDGSVADSNVGGEPLTYEQGQHEILSALERALEGLAVGESRDVVINADDGYGPIDETLFEKVPARVVPENGRYVGAYLVAQAKTGEQRQVRVHEVNGEEIIIDLNHPLAGQTLRFAIRILSVDLPGSETPE